LINQGKQKEGGNIMNRRKKLSYLRKEPLVLLLSAILVVFMVAPVSAEDKDFSKPHELVSKAQTTIKNFGSDPDMTWFRDNVNRAKGLFIVPQLLKAGFIVGGSGGSGVLLARDEKTGHWSYPAFYTMGSGSIGLQIGGAAEEIVLMVMSKKGMDAMLSSSFKLGGDVSVAAGPVGAGAKAATADIVAFSRSKGVYGGVSVEGAVIKIREGWNSSYYGESVRPIDILVLGKVSNKDADPLRSTVGRIAGK
jgi:lipid-binding SYLF domain-containing protein